ncbi:MAG: galactokinase family protein [Gemmatimonadaceae bacterium]
MEFWVPGRIEFLGKHTDYAGGRSLLCLVERGVRMTAGARQDDVVRVRDARSNETVECRFDPELAPPRGHWANYPFTVVRRLARDFPDARVGADLTFESDLPSAAGMSSSSALVVAVYMALAAVNELVERDDYRAAIETPEDLAEYLGCIEGGYQFRSFAGDEGVGTLSGCEDQTAMICGREGELVRYSFCPVRFETRCPVPAGYVFAVAACGVVAEKTSSALEKYNALSRRARAVAQAWRDISGGSEQTLADAIVRAGPTAVRDAVASAHVPGFAPAELLDRFDQFSIESEEIIPAATEALQRGDLSALGDLVDRSQASAEQLLGNQIPETVALARSARELGAAAASAFGAGFGGSVWALVPAADAGAFVDAWRARYLARFPSHRDAARFLVTRAGRPSGRIA